MSAEPWEDGWWANAQRAPSPHWDDRPPGSAVELIVIHAISLPPDRFGTGEVQRFFQGLLDFAADPYYAQLRELRVSAHFFIERTGKIWQHVPTDGRAWHAGVSAWRGRSACNDFSIGIELEGNAVEPFAELQYHSLNGLLGALRQRYPTLAGDAIAGHSEVAPGRKWDPGPQFDWQRLEHFRHD
ncbi:1,6-anhydro-N-acetylmuramyl-L-alanine amidase AmpD [Acidithiobacillus caldus]|uniref:1,6-anhydro-N-acetylmuramyl-L-alanine amidase AmpD n=1 Tax=Acidithiobacillus caldus (strain SM-1) TaxID=990288 RepID=F9ZS69_ACICS|nr:MULTISPECIES: 1,6-anhydro-N-acetylmuramyl-L-alanine amidase AmpD [Acidithiobacillus]AEK59048.1 N-acetylmuramyl-L-alanine amidase, negative regulator of AmpC, AmpD [Acidithiobacillus caldus SM-1]AUW33446.1 1,6-anhydro-N-acetylmuramyl-L-alanine amidase AmpD [Acidithiobacillus caldus]MBU2800962.1 1,6-anhydro-N-acetylmuramyl-L-alanine amidase AmpD [Acidithiobacillus caldus]MCE5420854.1 1,6-anhydro-N-acetylmuramyl-L-alanine amidase AmpD [Acidithiobacillus sp.]QER45987.1 N-acetyl-anhydromuranmyl-